MKFDSDKAQAAFSSKDKNGDGVLDKADLAGGSKGKKESKKGSSKK